MLRHGFWGMTFAMTLGCATVFGQGQGLPPGMPAGAEALVNKALSGPLPLVLLLSQKSVQTELKLDKGQKQRIDAVQMKAKSAAMLHLAAGADQAKLAGELDAQTKATNEEIEAILSKEQMARLKQVGLQLQGPQAILAPEFAEEMDLSAEQIAGIKNLKPGEDRALAAILDKDQRAKWREKIGKPFKGKLPMPPAGMALPQN